LAKASVMICVEQMLDAMETLVAFFDEIFRYFTTILLKEVLGY
jgi:hypothetical protein